MKNKQRLLKLCSVMVVLLLIGCSTDDHSHDHQQNHSHSNQISFKEFKTQTKQPNFSRITEGSDTAELANRGEDVPSLFVLDTLGIQRLQTNGSSATYSFFAYPVDALPTHDKEIYNVVYYFAEGNWKTDIFSLKDPKNTHEYEITQLNARSAVCWKTVYSFHCTRTGACANGLCDMCSLCVSSNVLPEPCSSGTPTPVNPGLSTNPGFGVSTGGGGIPFVQFYNALQLNPSQQGWLEVNPWFTDLRISTDFF